MERMPYPESVIVWRLKETMERLGVTQYALQRDSGISLNTIKSIYNSKTERPDLEVMNRLISTLRALTGQPVQLSDLLEYVPDDN